MALPFKIGAPFTKKMGEREKAAACCLMAGAIYEALWGKITVKGEENENPCVTPYGRDAMMQGLALSHRFWEEVARPKIETDLPDVLPHLAAGLCGEGSECFLLMTPFPGP